MKLLYSNILPLGTDKGQKTISETFNEYFQLADRVEIAVGYVSRASLEELDALVEHNQTQQINLTIGMYYIEGMMINAVSKNVSPKDKRPRECQLG